MKRNLVAFLLFLVALALGAALADSPVIHAQIYSTPAPSAPAAPAASTAGTSTNDTTTPSLPNTGELYGS